MNAASLARTATSRTEAAVSLLLSAVTTDPLPRPISIWLPNALLPGSCCPGTGGLRQQHQVIAVDDLARVARPHLRGAPAEHRRELRRVVGDQAAGDHGSARVGQIHRVAGGELAR